jgi:acetamidase/formamidase
MGIYYIQPERKTLKGSFSREYEPVMTIESGDTVRYKTLDAGWGLEPFSPDGTRKKFGPREKPQDSGHALCGPVDIKHLKAGMTLEIRINELIPGTYGWNSAGGFPNWQNKQLQIEEPPEITLIWELDSDLMMGKTEMKGIQYQVALKPFMGIMGMPPNEPGIHSTWPPRNCGGNIDCKELIKGSTLFLPVPVNGGLFSVGDGHALQGDGEVSGQAIECPMELVDLTFFVREDVRLTMPRANTPLGWITFGFDEDLNRATVLALDGMLNLMGELYGFDRREAMALASILVDLRITQIVNGVKGVHAVLPHGSI